MHFLDIGFEGFLKLKPHHIKEILPALSERIKFEESYDRLIKDGIGSFTNDLNGSLLDETSVVLEEDDLTLGENAIAVDNFCAQQINRCIVYQNLNVKTSQDILTIQSIEIKIVHKNYTSNTESLQRSERMILARAIIHHLLVPNLERV